jgi:hypothetical protein
MRQLEHCDAAALQKLLATLTRREQTGYDVEIEQQLALYRLGELDGPAAIARRFTDDADRGIYANGILLEGWATAHPQQAITWWRSMAYGKMKTSLLRPLCQGVLAAGGSVDGLVAVLGPAEVQAIGLPILEHKLENDGPMQAMEWFSAMVPPATNELATRLATVITNHLLTRAPKLEELLRWHELQWQLEGSKGKISVERRNYLVAQIGAKAGAKAIDGVSAGTGMYASLTHDLHRLVRGWVKAQRSDAESWVRQHRDHSSVSAVAFQLAMDGLQAAPEAAREWLDYMNETQQATAREVVEIYAASKRAREATAPPR